MYAAFENTVSSTATNEEIEKTALENEQIIKAILQEYTYDIQKDVIAEIKNLKAKIIIFFDPNFFAIRDYAIELMKELKKLKISYGLPCVFS